MNKDGSLSQALQVNMSVTCCLTWREKAQESDSTKDTSCHHTGDCAIIAWEEGIRSLGTALMDADNKNNLSGHGTFSPQIKEITVH